MSWLDPVNKSLGIKREKVMTGMIVFGALVLLSVGLVLYAVGY